MKSNKLSRNTWKAEESSPVREGKSSTVQVHLTFSFNFKKRDTVSSCLTIAPLLPKPKGFRLLSFSMLRTRSLPLQGSEALALPSQCHLGHTALGQSAAGRAPSQPHATLAPAPPTGTDSNSLLPSMTKSTTHHCCSLPSNTDGYQSGSSAS